MKGSRVFEKLLPSTLFARQIIEKGRKNGSEAKRQQGKGIEYFYDPSTLVNRLELLGGSIKACNDSNVIRNEFSQISYVLRKLGLITTDALKRFLREYVL